jgi:hypothetical protein
MAGCQAKIMIMSANRQWSLAIFHYDGEHSLSAGVVKGAFGREPGLFRVFAVYGAAARSFALVLPALRALRRTLAPLFSGWPGHEGAQRSVA